MNFNFNLINISLFYTNLNISLNDWLYNEIETSIDVIL